MSALDGYEVVDSTQYRGCWIKVYRYPPCYLCVVGGRHHGFFESAGAAKNSAQKYIDSVEDGQ